MHILLRAAILLDMHTFSHNTSFSYIATRFPSIRLHISQLCVDHPIQERPFLAHQLRLESLLDQCSDLLLRHVIQIDLSQASLDRLHDHAVIWSLISTLEIEG